MNLFSNMKTKSFIFKSGLHALIKSRYREITGVSMKAGVFADIADKVWDYFIKNLALINLSSLLPIKMIFRKKATIVFWSDGSKTVTRCRSNDAYDKEKGFLMAFFQKITRLNKKNSSAFFKELDKIENQDEEPEKKEEGNKTLFGAVMWINGEPILDGMRVFETEEERSKYIENGKKSFSVCLPNLINWTVIAVELGEQK